MAWKKSSLEVTKDLLPTPSRRIFDNTNGIEETSNFHSYHHPFTRELGVDFISLQRTLKIRITWRFSWKVPSYKGGIRITWRFSWELAIMVEAPLNFNSLWWCGMWWCGLMRCTPSGWEVDMASNNACWCGILLGLNCWSGWMHPIFKWACLHWTNSKPLLDPTTKLTKYKTNSTLIGLKNPNRLKRNQIGINPT